MNAPVKIQTQVVPLIEADILAGLIQHPTIRTDVALIVGPEHFRTPAHAYVLEWMREQFRDGCDLSAMDVIDALAEHPVIDAMPGGGRQYLAGVFAETVSAPRTVRAAELLGWKV